MKKVWKYALKFGNEFVNMPRGSKILSVGVQGGHIVIYALVNPDPNEVEVARYVMVTPTGVGPSMEEFRTEFIGTVFLSNTELVFHVFVEKET